MAATCSGRRWPRTSAKICVPGAESRDGRYPIATGALRARAEAARGDLADRLGRSRVRKQHRAFAHRAHGLRAEGQRDGARRPFRTAQEWLPRRGNRRHAPPPLRRLFCTDHSRRAPRPASSLYRYRGRKDKDRPLVSGCRGRPNPIGSTSAFSKSRLTSVSGVFGRHRNLKTVPRRYSRSVRRRRRSLRPHGDRNP